MEEVVLWAQLTSVQATGSCTTFLSFGFLTCEMGSQHHSWIKRASMGRSALQMDHPRVSTYSPPNIPWPTQAAVPQPGCFHQSWQVPLNHQIPQLPPSPQPLHLLQLG